MAETAAHLVDHVFPPLPVWQWATKVPKRLRYFLQRDTALQGSVLRIFLSRRDCDDGRAVDLSPDTAANRGST